MIRIYINLVDASSFITSCGDIPIISRARDWKPAFNGFNMSISSAIPEDPIEGQSVHIEIDDLFHYHGFISKLEFDYNSSEWKAEVKHFVMNLESYKVRYEDLHVPFVYSMIDPAATWNSFTASAATDLITKSTHGLSSGDRLLVRTNGTLPAPLVNYNVYYVFVVDANTFKLFSSFATYMEDTAWAGGDGSHGFVDLTDAGTGTHEYTTDLLFDKYNDWSFYRDIECDKPGTNNQFNSRLLPDNNVYPMQLIPADNADDEDWNLIVFAHEFGGSLPSPLSQDRAYLAGYADGDTWFLIYDDHDDWVNDISIVVDDTDIFWFSVLKRKSGDVDETTELPTSIISLKNFVEVAFQIIGMTLDTSNIDSLVFHKLTDVAEETFTWSEIYLMESVLYNIGQSNPVNYQDIKLKDQMTILEFMINLFQRWGLVIKFTGDLENNSWTLFSQSRDSDGIITPSSDPQYSIPEDNQIDYSSIEIPEDPGGWNFLIEIASFVPYSYRSLSFIMSNRFHQELQSYMQFTRRRQDDYLGAITDVSPLTNEIYFLLDKYNTNGNYNVSPLISVGAQGEFTIDVFENENFTPITGVDHYMTLTVNGVFSLFAFGSEKILCETSFLDQDIWTIKEILLNVEDERIQITQELPT